MKIKALQKQWRVCKPAQEAKITIAQHHLSSLIQLFFCNFLCYIMQCIRPYNSIKHLDKWDNYV